MMTYRNKKGSNDDNNNNNSSKNNKNKGKKTIMMINDNDVTSMNKHTFHQTRSLYDTTNCWTIRE
jgi:hypothetical protein